MINNQINNPPAGGAGQLTVHAGFMERGSREEGRVHLGPVGQQHLHALDAPRGAGVAERGAAVDIPGVHLQGRKKAEYLQTAAWQHPRFLFLLIPELC